MPIIPETCPYCGAQVISKATHFFECPGPSYETPTFTEPGSDQYKTQEQLKAAQIKLINELLPQIEVDLSDLEIAGYFLKASDVFKAIRAISNPPMSELEFNRLARANTDARLKQVVRKRG